MSTHNIPFSILKKKITVNYPRSAAMGFFQWTQELVRDNRGKRAISVRAIEVLLHKHFILRYNFTGVYTFCKCHNGVSSVQNFTSLVHIAHVFFLFFCSNLCIHKVS